MKEDFLHYVWQHQMLSPRLTTIDGQPIVVLSVGEVNKNAGPDFFNCRIRIGNVEWAGSVEIHIHSSDWNRHGHQFDAAYNNVVLHVVYEYDTNVTLQNGKNLPTLELKPFLHPSLVSNYDSLMAPPKSDSIVPCSNNLAEVPQIVIKGFFERLTVERIENKAHQVHRLLKESHGGWEQTCYWLMARYFGGKVNALPFELLAKSIDLSILSRWSDNKERLEALLFGQAGFLDDEFTDDYPNRLKQDYYALRSATSLKPLGKYVWKFYRIRPSAFPTIRISQFADLLSHSKNIFSTLLEITDVQRLETLFRRQASEYWNNHFQFDQRTEINSIKRLGTMQADLIIINAWIPLLFVYGVEHQQERYKEQALYLLSQIKSENNSVIRGWKEVGISPSDASQSQALLQLYEKYCHDHRCLECRIGYHILKHK